MMTLDLSKMSSAPWHAWECRQESSGGDPTHGGITNAAGWSPLVSLDHAVGLDPTFAHFAALARTAFDVMLRRGWYVVPRTADNKEWIVMNPFGVEMERGGNTGAYFIAADPFSALAAAEEWYLASGAR